MQSPAPATETSPQTHARVAGGLYLVIIVLGLWSEVFARGALIAPGDAAATAANILASPGLFRASFAADTVMALCDVALAILLLALLSPVSRTLSVMAAVFRLVQAATIAASLILFLGALLILDGAASWGLGADEARALAMIAIEMHGHGYDLGLIFFGLSCLVLGYLIARSGYFPTWLGYLAMAAGVAYLIGSYTLFLFPDYAEAVQPVYLVSIVSELALCLWLLVRGVNVEAWDKRLATHAAT